MFNVISKVLERPPIYTKIETAFWNDGYISKQMFKAHLNPEFEGASRKLAFIEKSVVPFSKVQFRKKCLPYRNIVIK